MPSARRETYLASEIPKDFEHFDQILEEKKNFLKISTFAVVIFARELGVLIGHLCA